MGSTTKKKARSVRPKEQPENFWELKLYISGTSLRSITAIDNLKKICEENLRGRYNITVVDVKDHPDDAIRHQIIVTPTLIRELPPPVRKAIGDLSNTQKVLIGLDIIAREAWSA